MSTLDLYERICTYISVKNRFVLKFNMYFSLFSLMIAISIKPAHAQIEKNIELDFGRCLESSDGNTIAINICTNKYYTSWDSLLNAEYATLINNIPNSDLLRLKSSQRKWLELRELDKQFNTKYSTRQKGSMWSYTNAYNTIQSTKYRALYLRQLRIDLVK